MRGQRLREKLDAGTPALNGWMSFPCAPLAEFMAQQGYDSVTVDMQHGMMGYDTALAMIQAINTTEVTAVVRVPSNEPSIIMRMLDAGAMGIICPMVNTPEQARAFVDSCLYAPKGGRSFGPVRVQLYAGSDYWHQANAAVMPIAMIETVEAMDNLDAILDTPGLYGIYIGPADFSLSFGLNPVSDQNSEAMLERYRTVIAAARKRCLKTGIQCSTLEQTLLMRKLGFDYLTAMTDIRLVSLGAQTLMKALQQDGGSSPVY